MSYSVTVELDVSDYGLLRMILERVAKAENIRTPKKMHYTTLWKVHGLEDDVLDDAARYILKQLPPKGGLA